LREGSRPPESRPGKWLRASAPAGGSLHLPGVSHVPFLHYVGGLIATLLVVFAQFIVSPAPAPAPATATAAAQHASAADSSAMDDLAA
jgi:hypothetical protein